MAIKSRPFGGVELSGEDADAFLRQVANGPTEEQRRIVAEGIKRGRILVAKMLLAADLAKEE